MTTTTTNRLEQIADRQRSARTMDLVFAALIAFLMIWSVASFRAASAKADTAGLEAPAAQIAAETGGACDVDVAC